MGLVLLLEKASQYAKGIETNNKIIVVIRANLKVNNSGSQSMKIKLKGQSTSTSKNQLRFVEYPKVFKISLPFLEKIKSENFRANLSFRELLFRQTIPCSIGE